MIPGRQPTLRETEACYQAKAAACALTAKATPRTKGNPIMSEPHVFSEFEKFMIAELHELRSMLQHLVPPPLATTEEVRRQVFATPEENKAHSKAIRARARQRMIDEAAMTTQKEIKNPDQETGNQTRTISEFEKIMIAELRVIRPLVEQQVQPIIKEEMRQLITATPEQRKAHNKEVIARAKVKCLASGGANKR